jgi:nucleoid-associated protein YgaU
MNLQYLVYTGIFSVLFIVSGCATKHPPIERNLAHNAIQNANQAGAGKMAIEEYNAAQSTLAKAEKLIEDEEFESAEKLLKKAITQAHQAETTAYIRSLNLAENRIHQLELQKEALLKAWRSAIADQEANIDFNVEEESRVDNRPTSYTVMEGENLFAIASRKRVYGDALLWPLIYKANRDQIKDPQQIYPGQRLTIPRDISDLDMEEARTTARESTIFQPGLPRDKVD